ncbi:hypothetical protein GCK32_009140 [Trichostrongylus colubriformis]|uniref:Uncharacterized protein n=1 Tax=Trichostrongylus colubriformis TaxID=6319 RepID=A0AAN8IHI7_TRICO
MIFFVDDASFNHLLRHSDQSHNEDIVRDCNCKLLKRSLLEGFRTARATLLLTLSTSRLCMAHVWPSPPH